jgi:hypothetical protein
MKLSLLTASPVLALVAFVTAAATGCAAPAGADDTGASSDEALSSVGVPNPSGAYYASVNAVGSGCPAGSWDAAISPDGQQFTVSFDQYEAIVNPGQAIAVKDCTLAIDLRAPGGLTFAVSNFSYKGYAWLDSPGMSARQTAKYYFSGNPIAGVDNSTTMQGPFEDSFDFTDTVAELVWSPCGPTRRLNAQTRLVLVNNAQRTGSGIINNTSDDADLRVVFHWDLSWRHC